MLTTTQTQKKTSLSQKVSFVLFASIFKHGLSLFSGIVTARILFPQDFGIISMAATFAGLIDVFSRFGFEAFIMSRQEISTKEVNSVYLSNILIGIFSAIIVIIGAPFVAHIYKTPQVQHILVFSAILFFINSLASIPRALLIKEMQQEFISKVEILQGFLNTAFIIIFALLGFRYLSYVIALLIANSVVCLIYLATTKWKFSIAFDKKILKQAFVYGKSFLPKTILNYFVYNSDYIFVGYLLGSTLLGYYCFGFDKALILASVLVGVHCNIFFPLFSKIQTNAQELKKTFFSLVEKQTFVLYPLIFIQILLAKEIINIIYGSRWDNSILTFQLILGYAFLRTTSSIIHVLFDAVDMPEQNLKHFLLITPMCVAAFFVGAKMGGLIGVSIAAFIIHSFTTSLLFVRASWVFKWGLKEIALSLSKFFIPLLLQMPIIIPLKIYLTNINLPNYAILLIIIPTCLILYLFFVRLVLKDAYENIVLNYGKKILFKLKPVLSNS